MSVIDDHFQHASAEQRAELERIRAIAHEMLPGADEAISYGMPTIKYKNKPIIGFDARAGHIGIYPYSGSVLAQIPELEAYETTKSAIREKLDNLLPKELIQKVIRLRLQNAGLTI
jgi:uncharacterized protein YdhG (YjbR/CyaY superfamily)